MKAVHRILAGAAVASLVGAAVYAARPAPTSLSPKSTCDGPAITPSTSAATPFNYTTGFEPGDGFIARNPLFTYPPDTNPPSGWINDQPCAVGPTCWAVTGAANRSTREGHVDIVHPDSGTQHLRLSHDPTTRTNVTGFNVGIDARLPANSDIILRPNAPNTVSLEVAIDTVFGMDFVVQPQNIAAGYRLTQTLFLYNGAIYTIDNACGAVGAAYMPFNTGWDTTGAYENYTVAWNTCKGEILFYYGGNRAFPWCSTGTCMGGATHGATCTLDTDCAPTCMWTPGTTTDQLLLFGDNYQGSNMDVDDINITMDAAGVDVCGNGFISYGCGEQCEPGMDANCPGRCNNCVCDPICTAAAPCPVVNGANGPFMTSSGFYTYTPSSPFVEIDDCGSIDRAGGMLDTSIAIFDVSGMVGYNDDCNTGTFGAGSDPNASCYNQTGVFNSCTCVANTGDLLIEADAFGAPPAAGSATFINVNKKAACAGAEVGSCCTSNAHGGGTVGCVDNVPATACAGAFDTWSATAKCAGIQCVCIPDCAGRECGDDGCGGICAPNNCDDGNVCTDDSCNAVGVCEHVNNTIACNDNLACTINDTCTNGACVGAPRVCSDNNVCNGIETCVEPTGCVPGTPLVCDDGLFCNGTETCDPIAGCVPGTNPCVAGEECTEVLHCYVPPIPTVSEWGLVVLTLLLLIGAKVYFSRRQAVA